MLLLIPPPRSAGRVGRRPGWGSCRKTRSRRDERAPTRLACASLRRATLPALPGGGIRRERRWVSSLIYAAATLATKWSTWRLSAAAWSERPDAEPTTVREEELVASAESSNRPRLVASC